MELDSFQYPLDEEKIQTHTKANRIGKIRRRNGDHATNFNVEWRHEQGKRCENCGRVPTGCPPFQWQQSDQSLESRYGVYGPNCVIYLGFIKRIAIFMLVCSIVFGLPMLIINLSGTACQRQNYCNSNNIVYKWSVYNILGVNSGIGGQAWLWLIFCFLMVLFTFYLRYYALGTYASVNSKNTTDSDYSLILRRLPSQTSISDIKNFIKDQFLQLSSGGTSIKDVIMINKQVHAVEHYEKQLWRFKELAKQNQQQKFVFAKLEQPAEFANAAIVRFNHKKQALTMLNSLETPLSQKILNYICTFYKPKTKYEIQGHKISIDAAPHPTDVLWHNFGYDERAKLIGKIFITLTAFAILIISSGVTLGISYWIELIISKKNPEPIILTICVVSTVMIFNKLIRNTVTSMTKIYKLDNQTDDETQQISLIVIHQSLNLGFFSAIAPILVKLPQSIASQTTESSSFPTVMFTTILIQAIAATVLDFVLYHYEIRQQIYRALHNKKVSLLTQSEALKKFKGSEVPFVKCYSFNVKMVWFGFLYGVVSPISIFVSFVGMLLTYFFQRFLFNSTYSIPFYGGPRINEQMIDLLDWTPLLVGVFNLFLYFSAQKERQFEIEPAVVRIYVVIIVLGVLHLLVPWNQFVKEILHSSKPQANTAYNPSQLQITYEQANPINRATPNILYRQFSLGNIEQEHEQSRPILPPTKHYKYQEREGPATIHVHQ